MNGEILNGAPSPMSLPVSAAPVPALPDRAAFLQRLEFAVRTAERQNSGFAVLLVDAALAPGDAGLLDLPLLDAAAAVLRGTVRLSDTVAFLSGSEFAVLLGAGTEEGAQRVAGKIIQALAGRASAEVAVGVALFGAHGRTAESVLRAAETALFQARRSGRAVLLASTAELAPIDERCDLGGHIGAAIEHDEFVLHFQPVVKLHSGQPVSVEALARWHHPQRGLLPAAEFMHLAEREQDLGALTLRLVERALNLLRSWHERGLVAALSLNLAPALLARPGIDREILARLHERALPAHCFTLELRDEGLTRLPPEAVRALFGLAAGGVCLALDSFGRGEGSLLALRELPVREIKVDAALSAQVAHSEADAAIMGALIALGRKLGRSVIAKGIESEAVRQKLLDLGCEYGQGFLFAPALDVAALEAWYAARH